MIIIDVCKDFSDTPGARYKSDGKFSGEEFRSDVLMPKYKEAYVSKQKLQVILDGGYGYPTSFLEEAFGGLAREYPVKDVLNTLIFVSDDDPSLVEEITDYINKAREK